MTSAIIYYSYSGNTGKVADILREHLSQKGEVETIELKAMDESDNFFIQATRAFRHKRAQIQRVNFNLSHYDLILFGTPVWAFAPAPAMNTFLDKCSGLDGKSVVLFATYGSGAGKERCLKYMHAILEKKGVRQFKKFLVQQFKANNRGFIKHALSEENI